MNSLSHVFVVNPTAGGGVDIPALRMQLEKLDVSFEIYPTRYSGDGARFVAERAEKGDSVRFYACGGDGTLKEVAAGAAGRQNVSVTAYPVGSGNDFVRVFGGREAFLNLPTLIAAEEKTIDLISVNGEVCINACHFGFDSVVASTMNKVKPKPLIGGKNAYNTGVAYGLAKGMKNHARILADGEEICSDTFLLCSLCNGGYVGGGYQCAPRSRQDDGLLELCLVKPVSRLQFLGLMGAYREGRHLDDPRFAPLMEYRQCQSVSIEAKAGFTVSLDGEIREGEHFEVKILPSALRFAIPHPEK